MCYNENMQELFNKYGIKLNEGQLKNFDEYFKLLVEYNEKYNLTAILEKNEVYVKHFLDSILGQKYLCGKSLIDIGSGGGFPALPLKIVDTFLSSYEAILKINTERSYFYTLIALMIGLTIFRVFVVYITCMAFEHVSQTLLANVRNHLFQKMQYLL